MHHAHRTTLTALALGIAGVLALGQAHATGFQIRENSVKNLGRANAGTAVAQDDASVVSNNPAAMVNLDRTTVQADLTVIDLTAEFNGSATSAFGTPVAGGDGGLWRDIFLDNRDNLLAHFVMRRADDRYVRHRRCANYRCCDLN